MVPRQAGAMCQSCISSISSNSGSTQNTNWYKGTYCEVTLPSDSASFSRNSQKEHLQQNVIFPDYIKFPSIISYVILFTVSYPLPSRLNANKPICFVGAAAAKKAPAGDDDDDADEEMMEEELAEQDPEVEVKEPEDVD